MTMISPIEVEAIRQAVCRDSAIGDGQDADSIAMRQFRHHTRNALQRILCQLGAAAELRNSAQGRHLIAEVEQRVVLTARISDALFGFTRAPGPLADRLRTLGESMVELLGDAGQIIRVAVNSQGRCPEPLQDVVVRVANEFLGNAVKHGMYARVIGRIDVTVVSEAEETRLLVADDGWGCGSDARPGEGLAVAKALAREHGGSVRLSRGCDITLAELRLPHVRP